MPITNELEKSRQVLFELKELGVQPIILGSGLPLFKNVKDRVDLKLLKTKTFGCGAVTLYYEPTKI